MLHLLKHHAVSGYFKAFPEEKARLEKIKKGKIIEIAI